MAEMGHQRPIDDVPDKSGYPPIATKMVRHCERQTGHFQELLHRSVIDVKTEKTALRRSLRNRVLYLH